VENIVDAPTAEESRSNELGVTEVTRAEILQVPTEGGNTLNQKGTDNAAVVNPPSPQEQDGVLKGTSGRQSRFRKHLTNLNKAVAKWLNLNKLGKPPFTSLMNVSVVHQP